MSDLFVGEKVMVREECAVGDLAELAGLGGVVTQDERLRAWYGRTHIVMFVTGGVKRWWLIRASELVSLDKLGRQ